MQGSCCLTESNNLINNTTKVKFLKKTAKIYYTKLGIFPYIGNVFCCRFKKHFRFGMHVVGSMLTCASIASLTDILFHLTVLCNTMCEQKARICFDFLNNVIEGKHVQIENIEVSSNTTGRVINGRSLHQE